MALYISCEWIVATKKFFGGRLFSIFAKYSYTKALSSYCYEKGYTELYIIRFVFVDVNVFSLAVVVSCIRT